MSQLEQDGLNEWDGLDDLLSEYLYDDFSTEPAEAFNANIDNICKLVETAADSGRPLFLLRLLFASVITALEAYLCDRFMSAIEANCQALRTIVETSDRVEVEPTKADSLKKLECLERYTISTLTRRPWHRLDEVAERFKSFGLDFTNAPVLKELKRDIKTRHIIVHHAGKKPDGLELELSADDIQKLIANCRALVHMIELQREHFSSPRR